MARPITIDHFRVEPGSKVRLHRHDTGWAQNKALRELGKETIKDRAAKLLDENREHLSTLQELELKNPEITPEQRRALADAKAKLLAE